MREMILTVAELNEYVRRVLASDPIVRNIRIKGEISNMKRHSSGHWYFTLKDAQSRIQCVMFRQYAQGARLIPRDGMRVTLFGSVGLFMRDGTYQFYAEDIREDGLGELYLQFEALKNRLAAEGLFDAALKRPLPLLPKKIGIVTSPTGAVLQDIRNVAARRFSSIPLVLYPVKVQGEGAAEEIAQAVEALGPRVDVLIVGRGGGSLEDLWPFNEEIVARAIRACPVPVISAVGHETDFTICDFAADMRAPTPSAAAEVAVPDRLELLHGVRSLGSRLESAAERGLMMARAGLSKLSLRLKGKSPENNLAMNRQRLMLLKARREAAGAGVASNLEARLAGLAARRDAAGERRLEGLSQSLSMLRAKRLALGPRQVLKRGYAMVMDDGVPVTRAARLTPGMMARLILIDGWADARIEKIKEEPADDAQEEAARL